MSQSLPALPCALGAMVAADTLRKPTSFEPPASSVLPATGVAEALETIGPQVACAHEGVIVALSPPVPDALRNVTIAKPAVSLTGATPDAAMLSMMFSG